MDAERIEYLAERHAQGALEPEDIAEIAELCKDDAAARQFVEALADYHEFRQAAATQRAKTETFVDVVLKRSEKRGISGIFVKRVTEAAQQKQVVAPAANVSKRAFRSTVRRRAVRTGGHIFAIPAAIAAVALLGLLIYLWQSQRTTPTIQPEKSNEVAITPVQPPLPAMPIKIATVLAVSEGAKVKRDGREMSLGVNGDLFPGDTVIASGPIQFKYTSDTTTVSTHAAAEFTLDWSGKAKVIRVAHGTLMASVAPQSEPMLFSSARAEARVLGTELDFSVQRAATRLSVHTGRVKFVRESDNASVEVNAGFTTAAIENTGPLVIQQLAPALPWRSTDVGHVVLSGTVSSAENGYSVEASGDDIWKTADGFHFIYQPLGGDGEIVARVASMKDVADFALGGVMIREKLSADSIHASCLVGTQSKAKLRRRQIEGGDTLSTGPAAGNVPLPRWVKLTRKGDRFTAFISADARDWKEVDHDTIKMGREVFVGVVFANSVNTSRASATFTDISLKK